MHGHPVLTGGSLSPVDRMALQQNFIVVGLLTSNVVQEELFCLYPCYQTKHLLTWRQTGV